MSKLWYTIRRLVRVAIDTVIYYMPVINRKHYDVIIVRSDGIGDFVLWMNAIDSYKNKFSGKSVLLICPDGDRSLAESLSFFDDVITYNRYRLQTVRNRISFMRLLKKIEGDVLIAPTWSRAYPTDYIVRAIKANEKIGVREGKSNYCFKHTEKENSFYTTLVDVSPSFESEFAAIESFTRQVIDPQFVISISDLSSIYKGSNSVSDGKYCLIALSSAEEIKIWNIDSLIEVITAIPKEYTILLSGFGNKDMQRAEYIKSKYTGNSTIINYVNKTKNINELISAISHACFVIGYDSVAVHIAAACKVRSICIASGADYARFIPYPKSLGNVCYHPRMVVHQMSCFGCGYKCTHPDANGKLYCLMQIKPMVVINKLNELLLEIQ